jgi:tRNA-specific 2-thiouridylase
VQAIDAARNALIVGPASQLGRHEIEMIDVSFVAGAPPPLPASITLKIRYTGHEASATLCPGDEGTIRIHLDKPLRDITPGQGAVFYQGDVVLGGGIITESPLKVEETEVT